VIRFLPSAADSSAAWAVIQANTPVVIGQLIVALCFLAKLCRISLIVINLPRGTFFISWSTSLGAGTT